MREMFALVCMILVIAILSKPAALGEFAAQVRSGYIAETLR
jgi:hypothetical protein